MNTKKYNVLGMSCEGCQKKISSALNNVKGIKADVNLAGNFVEISSEKEIDFVATRNAEVQYYQVAYLLADENTIRREFGAFSGLVDNFGKFLRKLDVFKYTSICSQSTDDI